jgi:hypothetical protein
LYSSRNIIRWTKSKGMRWAGHVVRVGKVIFKMLVEKPEFDHLGEVGRIILKWM